MKLSLLKKLTALILAGSAACAAAACKEGDLNKGDFNIVTSFYPVHILVMNIAGGIDGVSVKPMSESITGCIHDHVFTTADLMMIEGADVYVENGLGLETFNDSILEAYPDLYVIEAAENITDAPSDDGEINGHIWTDPSDYLIEIRSVCDKLKEADPEHADRYEENASSYIDRVQDMIEEYSDVISFTEGSGALVIDESLPSLCEYLNMDYLTVDTDHENSALSAGQIGEIISYMNDNGIVSIFTTDEGDRRLAEAIAEETGASIYILNPCLTGETYEGAYIDQMSENFEALRALSQTARTAGEDG